MTFREYRRAGETAEWDANGVKAYLTQKGYIFGPGGIATGVDGLVRADIDPNVPDAVWKADLDAFVPAASPFRTSRGYLIARARALAAKTPAERQATSATEQDLFMLLRLLKQDA